MRQKMPDHYKEIFCKENSEIVSCDYLLNGACPRVCELARKYHPVERAKFFKTVATNWSKDIIEDGFSKLPDVKTLGELAGKAVPTPIFDDIQEITRSKSEIEQGLGKIVAGFKFGKVVMNPATHARNVMSNEVLNWWKLGF